MPTSVTPVSWLVARRDESPIGRRNFMRDLDLDLLFGLGRDAWCGEQVHAREFVESVKSGRDFRVGGDLDKLGFELDIIGGVKRRQQCEKRQQGEQVSHGWQG